MARKPATEKLPPPNLVMPRIKARQHLLSRVQSGTAIRDRQIRDEDQLDAARNDRQKWTAYNTELLTRMFDNESIAQEYDGGGSLGFVSIDPSLGQSVQQFRDLVTNRITRLEAIMESLDLIPDLATNATNEFDTQAPSFAHSSSIFLVHGRDDGTRETVARFLEKLGLQAVVLHEQANKGRTIIEKFVDYSNVAFAVVILTGDDLGRSRHEDVGTELPRARQNVILELGFFLGKLGRARVCALYEAGVDIPSDYQGVVFVELDKKLSWRFELAKELKAAGLSIDLNAAI